MNSSFTIAFPILAAVGVLLWFIYWLTCHAAPKEKTLPPEDGRFRRADWLCMAAVTLVYAVVAFIGLGDTKAPQSFLDLEAGARCRSSWRSRRR